MDLVKQLIAVGVGVSPLLVHQDQHIHAFEVFYVRYDSESIIWVLSEVLLAGGLAHELD